MEQELDSMKMKTVNLMKRTTLETHTSEKHKPKVQRTRRISTSAMKILMTTAMQKIKTQKI